MRVEKSFNGWTISNVLIGGPIGLAIDVIDGAMYKLDAAETVNIKNRDKDQIYITLVKNGQKPNGEKIGQLKKA